MTNTRKTILHADDVARWRHYVESVLSDQYELKFAEDFESTLDELDKGQVDLLILDHLMPGTEPLDDACAVCAHLRKNYPDLPVIIYSGAWQRVDADRTDLEQKFDALVVFKDVRDPEKDDLRTRVEEVLKPGPARD